VRYEKSVTAISWIPSEAISGMPKLPFELGIGHYDEPPPDELAPGDLERLRANDRFREANFLQAWVDVEDGKIVDHGYSGGGLVGSTTFKVGPKSIVVPGVAFETIRADPVVSDDRVRFVQTVGGRAGFPAPRRVSGRPLFRIHSATAWTTLALTINADGSAEHELVGASAFPRHWVYDDGGNLAQKSGTVDFKTWYRESHGERTPWGEEDSPAVVAAAETELERRLSAQVMGGDKVKRRTLKEGEALVEQGKAGSELYLILDGVLAVEADGDEVAEVGPGNIVGEMALLQDEGKRTATLRARTAARVAVLAADSIDREALSQLAGGRQRDA
jgi:mannose-6-phosphate isomerase-like protein (cupin superfamily)